MKKTISFVIALAIMVSMFVVPSMAYGSDYFAAYKNQAHNGPSEYVFWFDAQDFAGQVSHGGAFRGAPYVSYLRDFSTPKGISGDEGDIYWGIDGENIYMIMNDQTRWTNDNCITNAYTFTVDVQLVDGYEKTEGGFDSTAIANVADRFAGIRMYTTSDADAYDASKSSLTPGASGIGFNVNVANNSKDQLIIYVANKDGSATTAAFDLADGIFGSWTTLKVADDYAGNMIVYINNKVVAELDIASSSVVISDAKGNEKASTTNANLNDKANFHVVNLNNGFLNIDNVGVKDYSDSDNSGDPSEPTAEPTSKPTDTPSYEEIKTNINIAELPSCGSFTAAGFPEDQMFLNFKSGGENDEIKHSIGTIDLSKYDKIVITYGSHHPLTVDIGTIILKGAADITSTVLKPTLGWNDTTTTATFDVSDATNNEELFIELGDNSGNGFIISAIDLVSLKEVEGDDNTSTDDSKPTDAPATQAPNKDETSKDEPVVSVTTTIDMSKLPTSGNFVAAGFPAEQKVLNFQSGGENNANTHSIGNIDLAGYKSITIAYGTDAGAQTVGTMTLTDKDGNVIASAVVPPCTTGWRETTTFTLDVSKAKNSGELFLNIVDATNGMVVTEITLVGSSSSNNSSNGAQNDTGDMMSFVIVIAAAALVVTALSKKRVF